jgi:hypothetical protein
MNVLTLPIRLMGCKKQKTALDKLGRKGGWGESNNHHEGSRDPGLKTVRISKG